MATQISNILPGEASASLAGERGREKGERQREGGGEGTDSRLASLFSRIFMSFPSSGVTQDTSEPFPPFFQPVALKEGVLLSFKQHLATT